MNYFSLFGCVTFAVMLGLLAYSFLAKCVSDKYYHERMGLLVNKSKEYNQDYERRIKELEEYRKNSKRFATNSFWFVMGMLVMWVSIVIMFRTGIIIVN